MGSTRSVASLKSSVNVKLVVALSHAAIGILWATPDRSDLVDVRSGLSVTAPAGVQLRTGPLQRAGLAFRVAW